MESSELQMEKMYKNAHAAIRKDPSPSAKKEKKIEKKRSVSPFYLRPQTGIQVAPW